MELPAFFESLIKIQRKEIRGWWIWVIAVALGGAAMVISGALGFKAGPGTTSNLQLIGGAFIGVCAAFPYKNIPPRRERINTYAQLKTFYETTKISDDERRKLFMDLGAEALRVAVQRGPNG